MEVAEQVVEGETVVTDQDFMTREPRGEDLTYWLCQPKAKIARYTWRIANRFVLLEVENSRASGDETEPSVSREDKKTLQPIEDRTRDLHRCSISSSQAVAILLALSWSTALTKSLQQADMVNAIIR
ncbi:Uromodulin-Like 1 [Manis pentadactyla]|nr:Uromodulin-Like 1 [Manis pentadactyla]